MDWKKEWKILAGIAAVFLAFFYMPLGDPVMDNAIMEAFKLTKWYAQEHVVLCLLPAFFIAGAIGVFVSKQSVMKYLGNQANKIVSYAVASVSGSILAVCSCTILPLFAGIYRMGAGIGPAIAFLYAGPAINVMAIILTANILGIELGIARAAGAIVFSIIIGLIMQVIFGREEKERIKANIAMPSEGKSRPIWQTIIYFALMTGILVFANWARPEETTGLWHTVFAYKWIISSVLGIALFVVLMFWFEINRLKLIIVSIPVVLLALLYDGHPMLPFAAAVIGLGYVTATSKGEMYEWFDTSWDFAKQILPLLFYGVLAAGLMLGTPGGEGLIPGEWVSSSVGGNSILSNLFASVAGAFMYFATLTEVPILQGLLGSGMGEGPALALLLAGPALSLPNMLVIKSVIGLKKTIVYILLVIIMATITGFIYGNLI